MEWRFWSIFHAAFPLQSAGGEWKGTCRDGRRYVSQLTLLHHLIMRNNFGQCPALISLCGNSSLVPNCGARHAQRENTSEKKGNNWNCPLPYTCLYIVYVFEGVYLISFRHFILFYTVIPTKVTWTTPPLATCVEVVIYRWWWCHHEWLQQKAYLTVR